MTTEQEMKEGLDGKFFTFHPATQEVRTKKVSKDYIPTHKPVGIYDEQEQLPRGRQWTELEDQLITKMFQSGYSFREMAKHVGGSTSAVHNRWLQICVEKGIRPPERNLHEKYSRDVHERIAHLKIVKKMTLRQIARETGMTLNQVAGIWRRYKVNNDLMDEAA